MSTRRPYQPNQSIPSTKGENPMSSITTNVGTEENVAVVAVTETVKPAINSTRENTKPVPIAQTFDTYINSKSIKDDVYCQAIIGNFQTYIGTVKKGKMVTANTMAKYSYSLFVMIKNAIANSDAETIKQRMRLITRFFKEYENDCFGEAYVFRSSEAWPGSKEEYNAFCNIVTLILNTKDLKSPGDIQKTSGMLDKAIAVGFSEADKNKLLSFYV